MPWVIFAAAIWLIILIFLRVSLVRYWSAGLWALLVGYFLNDFFIKHGCYSFKKILYPIQAIPAAYLLGLAGIGIIVVIFLPAGKAWQLPYLIMLSVLFAGLELLAKNQGYLIYVHWTLYDSILYKLFAFIAIAWLSNLTIKHRKSNYLLGRGIF